MPGAGIALLGARAYQWGRETVARGTVAAATSKIAAEFVDFTPIDFVDRPKIAKGVLIRNPGGETVIGRGTKLAIPSSPLIYDQIQNILSSLKGAVAPTGAGPYTWLYAPSLTADPAPDTWTLERRLSDGTNNIDQQFAYCCWDTIKISYEAGKPIKFAADGFGRREKDGAITAGQTLPNMEIPPTPLAQVWIDSTWGTLGTTVVAGQVLKAEWTIHTGLKPKMALDGRADLDFSTYVFDAEQRGIDLTMTVMVKPSAGQYATEKTAAEAQTLRAIRAKVLGTGSREVTLDALVRHDAGSVLVIGHEDGQDIVDFKLTDANDGVNWLSAKVVNAVAAYA